MKEKRNKSRNVGSGIPVREKIVIGILSVCLLGFLFCLPRQLFDTPYATVVVDRNHQPLGARISADGQWRFPVTDTVPEKFKTCIIEFEDRYFRYHGGMNPVSMLRAAYLNAKGGKIVSGGSTLTMQTVRLARNRDRTVWEKIKEIVLATRLECRYGKDKILALYASHAPFGGNVVGIESACWRYFGHPSSRLSWAEAATLAVLPNAPSMIHLSKNRNLLLEKRNHLLKRLLDRNLIDQTTYELALSEELPDEPLPLPQIAPHVVSNLYTEFPGLYHRTTLDRPLQLQMEAIVSRWHAEFSRSDIRNLAAIVIDVEQNEVIAYCGNVNFGGASGNQVDIIQSPRSTGSILKPFLYAAMLQEGELLPHTLLPDIPLNINGFAPQNFDLQFNGAVPASEALARSLNVPAVSMLRQFSVPKFYDLLKKGGIKSLTRSPSNYGLSLILGGAEATLWDVCCLYNNMSQTLRTDEDLTRIERPRLLYEVNSKTSEPAVFDRTAIWHTYNAIKELNRPEEIDWQSISSMQTIAWKTGTSYGFRDAWAVGTTPKYVVGVWVGNADGEGKAGLTGARTAGPVMFDIFNILPSSAWFQKPDEEMITVEVCKASGHLKGMFCEETEQLAICPAGEKTESCPYHQLINVTPDEKYQVYQNDTEQQGSILKSWFVLPPVWAMFYQQHHSDYRPVPPFKTLGGTGSLRPMQFLYPNYNARLHITKQLDGTPGAITFEIAHNQPEATIYWHLDQDYIASTQYLHQLPLTPTPGKHTLTVVDSFGHNMSLNFTVD